MKDIFIWFTSEKYRELAPSDDQSARQLAYWDELRGEPLPPLDKWRSPRLIPFMAEGEKLKKLKPLGDFASSRNPYLVSQHAVDEMGDLFHKSGVLYPLIVADAAEPYFMFVCKNIVDCLDYEKSKIKWSPINPNQVAVVLEPAFNEAALGNDAIFAIPEVPHRFYVTETFKDRVRLAKLKGLKLSRIWFDESPWYS